VDYKYVGGSYGLCNEFSMMEELQKNGPFVVSFEPDYNFMMYKTGIYHTMRLKSWKQKGISKPEWQKVDHSVLLVGWGTDPISGEKFWILQNTWGPQWGEEGFFRIKRGSDELGVESICESASPIIVDNKTKLIIQPSEFSQTRFEGRDNILVKAPLVISKQNMRQNGPVFSIFDIYNS
jgi:cathepsin C